MQSVMCLPTLPDIVLLKALRTPILLLIRRFILGFPAGLLEIESVVETACIKD